MKRIITIGRQYASHGGHIAKKLSELTGIPCYDREALVAVAETHGIPRETFEKADEQATSSFLYSLAMSSYSGNIAHFGTNDLVLTDRVFSIQSQEIKKIAAESDCIIVGRCADDVLAGCEGLLKVFVYAPIDVRVIDYMHSSGETNEQAARKTVTKADKKRSSYYNFYTGKSWSDPKNYHISIDSSVLGIDKTAELIKNMLELR